MADYIYWFCPDCFSYTYFFRAFLYLNDHDIAYPDYSRDDCTDSYQQNK